MLPTESASARSVVGVASDLIDAIRGGGRRRVRSAVLVVVDGLGALSLRAHAGHARRLAGAMARRDVGTSVFPSTTAAALTSILTGAWPGEHGLVGYRVRDPRRDVLVNQLTDWERAGIDPARWQAVPTVFERFAEHPGFAVGSAAYERSGFTRATLRGARYVPAGTAAERVLLAYALAEEHEGAIVYCYLPEVDKAGHKHGIASPEWIAALEEIDAALDARVPSGVGVLVTADHGMLDVPAHRRRVIAADDPLMDGVRHIGGEPRMLHVYLEPDVAADPAAERWQQGLQEAAMVGTRAEAIAAGLFGPRVTDAARARIGDLLVVARGNRAIHDASAEGLRSLGMIGQHGGITAEERLVPAVRLGALAD